MKAVVLLPLLLSTAVSSFIRKDTTPSDVNTTCYPTVVDESRNITYEGVFRSEVEAFLGIQYGQDTGGQNRFKRPQPYTYEAGSTVTAQSNGPACPQPTGDKPYPIYLSNITETSENCLLLNVKRPNGTTNSSQLPVMVFIHGDSFIGASKDEIVSEPSGLILESVENDYPVMHVAMNYRLGSFGFAQNEALRSEGSLNAGIRDQRLAIEWVQENIAAFGGDPNKTTIFGQSSGGLAVGLQILAYGASKPVPFQQAICESQSLEGGITGNFTIEAMTRLLNATGCDTTSFDSAETVACLRNLTMQELLDAQTATYLSTPGANVGDEWLPVVDGDILPDAPSNLIDQGKFANVTAMMGWCDGDFDIILSTSVRTQNDSDTWIRDYLPGFNETSISTLLSLYPVDEFQENAAANLTNYFYRTSRVARDIVFVCQSIYYGQALTRQGNKVYFYDQNQTFTNPLLTSLSLPNLGVGHTSEFAYVFGNLSHYDVWDFPFLPNATDYELLQRESRSWSTFAATGSPSLSNLTTLQGWNTAFNATGNSTAYDNGDDVEIYVIGGGQEGLFAQTNGGNLALNAQRLQERCAFLNSPDIIKQQGF